MVGFRYVYHGKASHAAAAPQEGVNALNAVIRLFTGIDALRQHLRSDVRIHGIITDGGLAPNVVPDYAAANFMLRCLDRDYLVEVSDKVRAVAEGAALMTGATLEVVDAQPMYDNVRPNAAISKIALSHVESVGLALDPAPPGAGKGGASTDFGNVSQVVPAYYTRFAVSQDPVPGHSLALAAAAKTDLAHDNAIAVAKLLALTACDLISSPELLSQAIEEFKERAAH